MNDIAANLDLIHNKIRAAAKTAARDAADVRLVAVSKGKSEADVRAALTKGQRLFGENRVQEAKAKFTALRGEYPGLELHLIGPLQTNKAEDAVKIFDVIETLDRPKLAQALAAATKKTGRRPRLYAEINIGAESQKAGIAPGELGVFLQFCRVECGLRVEGLMCIPPQAVDPSASFARMQELAAHHKLPHISMGMSGDFEAAIQHGATEVRIGSAIFGARLDR